MNQTMNQQQSQRNIQPRPRKVVKQLDETKKYRFNDADNKPKLGEAQKIMKYMTMLNQEQLQQFIRNNQANNVNNILKAICVRMIIKDKTYRVFLQRV